MSKQWAETSASVPMPFFRAHSISRGISIALLYTVLVILLRYSGADVTARMPGYILLPLALSALLFAHIISRFFTRNLTFALRLLTMPLIFAGAMLMPRLITIPLMGLAILFILFWAVFFLLLPALRGGIHACVQTFCLGLSLSVVMLFLLEFLLQEPGDTMKPAGMLVLLLSLAGILFLTYQADGTLRNEESGSFFPRQHHRLYGLLSLIAWLAGLSAAMMVTQPQNSGDLSESMPIGAALFLMMTAFHIYLLRKKRIWMLNYTVFTTYLIGALLWLIPSGGAALASLSVILLMSSSAGLLILSFCLLLHSVSLYNRTLLMGLSYVLLFALMTLVTLYDPESYRLLTGHSGLEVLPVILVLLAAPLFFRFLDKFGETTTEAPTVIEEAIDTADAEEELFDADQLAQSLTNAERKVYELILRGYSNQQMADELFVSINTIKFHIKNILGKAGMERKSQLVSHYLQQQKR